MSLITPESVWNLQQSLQAKAKANPTLRFYSLYDKIYRRDVLAHGWQRCRANPTPPAPGKARALSQNARAPASRMR